MGMDRCNAIDNTMAFLAKKELVYLLGKDPYGIIAKRFPAHPGYAFVVEWFMSDERRVLSLLLTDTGQLYERPGIFEQTALFDTYDEAKAAAEEFDRGAGVGTTISLKFEVGSLPPPKGGRHNRRSK